MTAFANAITHARLTMEAVVPIQSALCHHMARFLVEQKLVTYLTRVGYQRFLALVRYGKLREVSLALAASTTHAKSRRGRDLCAVVPSDVGEMGTGLVLLSVTG